MSAVPFTVSVDLNLGNRIAPFLVETGQDVTVRKGAVPTEILEPVEVSPAFSASKSQFLLKVPNGVRILVSDGATITYDGGKASDREIALFLLGSAWGALCYQRGLLPLHASAILHQGSVHAFTGPSGAGKSTLTAALAKCGRHFFTDDILIIDPEAPGTGTICYSGQKDLKLWKDALVLTQAKKKLAIRDVEGFEKFFAAPANLSTESRGTLASLTILKNDATRLDRRLSTIEKIDGAKSIHELRNSVYRPRFAHAIWGKQKLFMSLAQLIKNVEVHEFNRTKVTAHFEDSVSYMDAWIERWRMASANGNASED